jgi:hypothetical protein
LHHYKQQDTIIGFYLKTPKFYPIYTEQCKWLIILPMSFYLCYLFQNHPRRYEKLDSY